MRGANGRLFTGEFWVAFWRHATENALHSAMQIAAILLAYLLLSVAINRLIDGVLARLIARDKHLGITGERAGRLQTMRSLCKSTAAYVLFFVFGVTMLKAIGFDIMPFITTASVIGLAVGFGSQKLVKDVISGVFIIVDDLFVVGDTVTISGVTGRVQEMGMRVTRMVDATGKLIILSNGDIGTITNLSRNPIEEFVEVGIGVAADLNRAIQVITETGAALYAAGGHRLNAPPRVLGISALTAAAVTVRVSVVSDPLDLPAEQMRLRAAIREALAKAEIPLA
jgi:moderate conductance mechanosensitive channel